MGHGGPVETSLLRHLHPELVDEDRFAEASDEGADRWGEWMSGVNLAYDTDEFSESGAVGDPAQSDPAVGEALLDQAGDALADLLAAVARRDVE
jgi:creatinine amidohydrolase